MIKKQIKQELFKGKAVSLFLTLFIVIATALCANAVDLIFSLSQTMKQFSEASKTSHMLQMHSGSLDESEIEKFANESDIISQYEIVKMINISGDKLTIRPDGISQLGSVIDNGFVIQNEKFDYLLDSNNEVAKIAPGYVGVPVYYQMQYNLKTGDKITIETDDKTFSFIIADFIKDSEMNSSYISSKRFLVNEKDWKELNKEVDNVEYIIEFLADDPDMADKIESDYVDKNLPSNGPKITFSAIKLLNILTDIITAAILVLATLFLVFISVLCVRFAMITSIDQEYTEIAVMKGLGIPSKYISKIFMRKYMIIVLIGSVIGFISSFGLVGIIQKNMSLYMGLADKTIVNYLLQLFTCVIVGLLVLLFCKRAVNKTRKINVVESLQGKGKISTDKAKRRPYVATNGRKKTNMAIGIKYLFSYKKPYIIICCIFSILILLVLLPIQLTTTMKSEEFSAYMGISKCDLRIDFGDARKAEKEIKSIDEELANDSDIQKYGIYNTYLAYTKNQDGESVYLNFESGDYDKFDVSCIKGNLPTNKEDIAISYLLAKESDKNIGDKISIEAGSNNYEYTICGIYQDITNGGKSAKISQQKIDTFVYRSVININLINNENNSQMIEKLDKDLSDGKITDLKKYINQTMGDSIEKFTMLSIITLLVVVFITIFTISIFMKLLTIRYKEDIATMKGLGLRNSDIKLQYLTRILVTIIVGIIIGEILVKTLGQFIVSSVMASMGASQIVFETNILLTYVLIPCIVIILALITILNAGKVIKKIKFLSE